MIEPDFLRTTRTAYDSMAALYAESFANGLEDHPLDRAMLIAFADLVRANGVVRSPISAAGRAM